MKAAVEIMLCLCGLHILFLESAGAQESQSQPDINLRRLGMPFFPPLLQAHTLSRDRIHGKRTSQYSAQDWGKLIDVTWGPGQGAATQLQIFDSFWDKIDRQWAGFPNLSLDWDVLYTVYRTQIGSGLSRGRFYALMSRVWLALQEHHTSISDFAVDTIFGGDNLGMWHYKSGVPLLTIGTGWWDLLGAPATAMSDSTALIYRVAPGNPLGLKPGDVVLGYDGVSWMQLYRRLLDNGVPVSYYWSSPGSTPESRTYEILSGLGWSWGMFDTIDVLKYSTGDTLHLPTAPLASLSQTVWASDQVPVPGVPMPQAAYGSAPAVSWGVVQGTNIGYIYVWDWASVQTGQLFRDGIYDLLHRNIDGLVIDFRMNWGGDASYADDGLSQLFDFDPSNNLSFALHDSVSDSRFAFKFYSVANVFPALLFTPAKVAFNHPIAVLIGPGCLSSGDLNAFRMRFHPRARFFGKPTNGAFVGPTWAKGVLYGAWHYQIPTSTISSNAPGEGYLIHRGVKPDEEVWLTKDGVAKQEDDVVKRALQWITTTNSVPELVSSCPAQYQLSQNYPNPFNPVTTIRYSLPRRSHVTLTVFDILGQVIAALVQGQQEPGTYEVRFDGSNIASGVYFYRMQAGDYIAAKKVLLTK